MYFDLLVLNMGLYINSKGKWEEGPNAKKGEMIVHTVRKTFFDVCFFYANMIDYFRVLMGLAALVVINLAPEYKQTIASLIFGSVLLDWIDGPIARAYNQSTVMGCGWDWFADLLAQYDLAIWCVAEKSDIALIVMLFSAVEFGTALFDFAMSATSVYPEQHDDGTRSWFFIVEKWFFPDGSFSRPIGEMCWLSNTLWPISIILGWHPHVRTGLGICAFIYAWHECCQFVWIVSNWIETTASYGHGIQYQRPCTEEEKTILQETLKSCQVVMDVQGSAGVHKEIHWTNLYAEDEYHPDVGKIPSFPAYEAFVHKLIAENYLPDDPRHILSYGFIVGPANGTKSQNWHHDYADGVSNIMIPMTRDTTNNATQFMRMPHGRARCFHENDKEQEYPPPHELLEAEQTTHMEVTQVISEPFSILKLMPSVLHRGIANREDYDRIIFFLSTSRKDRIPKINEGTIAKLDETGFVANVVRTPEDTKANPAKSPSAKKRSKSPAGSKKTR